MLDVSSGNTNIPLIEHGLWVSQAVNFYLLEWVSGKSEFGFGSLETEPF